MKRAVVAILGRPNVGKSTLFNRIIRKREAIVDDMPGVTRDRNYALTDWAGYEFELLDTGGYVPESDDIFETAIREQVNLAISEANVIIFVTDITTGVTALDLDIANILKKSGIPVLLVVNKIDNDDRLMDIHEFYRLGMGEPYALSAMGGRYVGDLLDMVLDSFEHKIKAGEYIDDRIKLAIIGRPNVGKSSFVNAILGHDKHIVTDIAGTTRDAIDTELQYQKKSLVLIDTAGLRRRTKVKESVEYFSNVRTNNAIHRCDIAMVLIDATQGIADQDKKIIRQAIDEGKGIVVGVNKWDLVEKDTMTSRNFEVEMQDTFRDLAYIPILFVSCLTKQRIFKLLDIALSVYEERKRTIQTAELNKFLEIAIAQHHPPAFGDKYVKINYLTQVKHSPPTFVFFTNEPRGIKQNYRNYLENQLRNNYGFLGVPVRMIFRKKN